MAYEDRFEDREEHTPQEVRAGLTEYMEIGYVAADLHSESGSRTFDYACTSWLILEVLMKDDDWAASIVARHLGHEDQADALLDRSRNWRKLYNKETGFMEARNSDGSWAGEDVGWTEGDHWAYSLDVMVGPNPAPPFLILLMCI
jgi:putative alpha-1,2-mannosidase